jgi:hypothetical protein
MEMACPCLLWSRLDNAATPQTSALSLTPFPCPDQGEDAHGNGRPAYVSIVLMALVTIDDRSKSGASAAFAPNALMRRKAGCAKGVGEDRLHASMLKRTKAATSSSARSTD